VKRTFIAIFSLTIFLFSLQQGLAVVCCIDQETFTCNEITGTSCGSSEDQYEGICAAVQESGQPLCQTGCCCAGETASNPDEWNLDEESMLMNSPQCADLGRAYDWESKPTESSCVDVCSGSIGTPTPTNTYTIDGTVADQEGNLLELATVYIPTTGSSFQDSTNEQGEYEIQDVPELSGYIIAGHEGCLPYSEAITVDENKQVTIELNCNQNACEPSTIPTITADILRGTGEVRLAFTSDDNCGNREYYQVIRTEMVEGEAGSSNVFNEIQAEEYIDSGLEANTEYCYRVAAKYPSGLYPSLTEQDEACITTGDEACMNNPPEGLEWCQNTPSAVVNCNEDNIIEEQECSSGMTCTTVGNGVACVQQPPCDRCNGLFGKLSNLVMSIWQGGVERACDSPAIENFCYEDKTTTVNDAYKSCAQITSCEDYLSQAACGDNNCAVPNTCSWSDIFPELGLGICQGTDEGSTAQCNKCEDVFGDCTQTLCSAISNECYYDGEQNGLPTDLLPSACIHKDDMACRFYDTQEDCTAAGSNVQIDAQYSGSERTGGSHQVRVSSNDRFGIGLCAWNDQANKCYKNADAKTTPDPEDDCIENGVFAAQGVDCLQDAQAPTTELLIPAGLIGAHEVTTLNYVTKDNHYLGSDIVTNFCIDEQGRCYPTQTLSEAVSSLPDLELGEQATIFIRYYSQDLSENLEEVQTQEVTIIEMGIPRIEQAEIIEGS